ncbi:coiled-coil domain-containing protein 24 isoform X2 [Narcine bancroftii]|uniref:coiled-coil domain-containing protein 24 isoform X2 n=1 Tax=Narcine bancroftii TaxID=1343680 RepID=UPI003831E7D0
MNLNENEDSKLTDSYEQPSSLWKLIEECVPPCERDEIRIILGESAVDLTLDLHGEVAMLLEIWRSMRTSKLTLSKPQVSRAVLPESPAIKDLLRHELKFLLLNILNKAHKEGRNESDTLSSYNPDVVNFALGQNKAESGANGNVNEEGMKNKQMVLQSSQTTSNCENESFSCLSHLKDNVEVIKDKVNVTNVDEIVTHLQSILQEESKMLEKYIQFLQECLEEEHNCSLNLEVQTTVPSIAELREERKILERDLKLSPPSTQNLAQVHKPSWCRSSQKFCRRIVNPSEGGCSSTETTGQSESDLEQRMKLHSVKPLGKSSTCGIRDTSTRLKYSGILTTSSQITSCRTADFSIPSDHSKETSTRCVASKGTCGHVVYCNIKTHKNIQSQKMDDISRILSANQLESACDRTSMAESMSFNEERQKALMYSWSSNCLPSGHQSVAFSTQTGVHCTTQPNRILLSSSKNPVEDLPSVPKQDGYILNPAPPTTEKPIGTQGNHTRRLRRACIDRLAGHT